MLIELSVHEGVLHEGLTIVEHTIDLNGRDVLAQRGELALLNGRDLTLRIEHIDMDAIDAEETVGYSRARISRGGHEDVHLLAFAFLLDKVLE